MCGIQTDAEPLCRLDELKDCGEMFQLVPERGPLPGGDLETRDDVTPGRSFVNDVQRRRDAFQAEFFTSTQVRARVGDQVWNPQLVASTELFHKKINTLFP